MAKKLQRNDGDNQYASSLNFEVKQFGEPEERILRFIGSDETPDRDGDVVSVNGWDLKNYKANPVFLWAHDYSIPPIGKALNVGVEGKSLMFDIQFPEKGIYPLADLVYNLYKGGFLNATSVGFTGKEAIQRDDDAVKDLPEWRRGIKFLAQELLELSAVPVPSNPSALQQAKSAGALTDSQYASLMGFIGGEFVINSSLGVETMKGIKSVYELQSKSQEEEQKVEDNKPTQTEPEVKEPVKEPEATQPEEKQAQTEKSAYSFLIDAAQGKTLLVDNTSGKILGDVTEEVKHLVTQAVTAVKAGFSVEEKAGAVLSKQNKSRLSQAKDLIIEVLGQVEGEEGKEEQQSEEEKSGAVLPEEDERTTNTDTDMSAGTKSATPETEEKKEPEQTSDDGFVLELVDGETEQKEQTSMSAEDVAQMVKSAVADALKNVSK